MYQLVIIAGNLGRDPEMRYLPSGKAVTNFSVATSEKWTGQDGQKNEVTTWWRVSTFGKLAEVSNEYLKKGSKVLIEGKIKVDPATGSPKVYEKKDGTSGTSLELTASTVKFLSSRNGESHSAEQDEVETGDNTVKQEEDFPF